MKWDKPWFFSTAIMVAYLLIGYIFFCSGSFWTPLTILYLPFTLGFLIGYGNGEVAGWSAMIGSLMLLWWFVHTIVRSIMKS